MNIRWNTQDIPGDVSITLSRDGEGGTFETIADSTENDGNYDWKVTGSASANCVLKIEPLNDPAKGTSRGPFSLIFIQPAITVNPATLTVSEPDGSATFNISLTSEPAADVTIGLYSTNTRECNVSPMFVTLGKDNWAAGVTATVTSEDNNITDGSRTCTIMTTAAISFDENYNGIDPDDVTVIIQDDDTGLSISSVYPALGLLGEDLPITITGSGFDNHTQVSMIVEGQPDVYPYTEITVSSKTSLSLTLHSPQDGGDYTLKIFNANEEDELENAVTFDDSEAIGKQKRRKAIIVAGGGPYDGNVLWKATRTCADKAYHSLYSQGYTIENIYYLTPEPFADVTGDGNNDADGDATLTNLDYAINTWAKNPADPTDELLIYMTDHGGDKTFMLNISENPDEILIAQVLDNWLDKLQETMPGKLIVIYDACMSGSFLSEMTPPAGKERYVITGASADERAWFLDDGELSFSYHFWDAVYFTGRLYRSFLTGKEMTETDQTALIDINGDGTSDIITQGNLDNDILIGRGRVAAAYPPVIENICGEQELGCGSSATLWAGGISAANHLSNVWARIIPPPDSNESQDVPVSVLPAVKLRDTDKDGTYDGIYEYFTETGTYKISIYATDKEGAQSVPGQTRVTRTCVVKGDISGEGDVDLADAIIALMVLAGSDVSGFVQSGYAAVDVNGDGEIGLEEAIYILTEISGN